MYESKELSTKEKQFISFINRTIAGAAKTFFSYERKFNLQELLLIDDDDGPEEPVTYDDYDLMEKIDYKHIEKVFKEYNLFRAAKSLTLDEKLVIFLLIVEGYSGEYVAEYMNIHEKSVFRIQKRALRKMRKALGLGEEGFRL